MFHDLIWSSVQPAFRNLIVSGGRNAASSLWDSAPEALLRPGVFAFLVIIGVFPRLIGKTGTKRHILLYGTVIVSGGVLGNIADLYEFPIPLHGFSSLFLGIFGLAVGIFVGCLVMSLAETLKALPVISRRIYLAVGLQYLILSIALGKLAGSLAYFLCGMSAE